MTRTSPHAYRTLRSLLCTTALVAATSAFIPHPARAEPQGGVTVGGNASISSAGSATTITQSTDRAIIRWNSFDVGSGERVTFQQPSRSSITVNRIQDSKPSQINGQITATGNVMLLNPNGVVFGTTSRVDVGGLVASSSDLEDDAAFLAGGAVKLTRPGHPDATISNHGNITVGEAGLVGLVAPHVENSGVIQARLGRATLASGDISTIDLAGDGLIKLEVSDAVTSQHVTNTGTIKADGGEVLITAGAARNVVDSLISNTGIVQANTVDTHHGEIRLVGQNSVIQNTGSVRAEGSSTTDGGNIHVDGKFVALGGTLSTDGRTGGNITVDADTLSLADTISADGTNGKGGNIALTATQNTWEISSSHISADGLTDGGRITSFTAENLTSSGHYSARGENGAGGQIDLSGGGVKLMTAEADASGETAGGTIRVGGEYQGGKNLPANTDEVPNAQIVTVSRGSRLRADGEGDNADGGTVVVWSDLDTMALGTISATPGLSAGHGGLVEVSSAGNLTYDSSVQTGRGTRSGSVLLDPKNIIIANSTFNPTAIIMGRSYTGGNNVDMSALSDIAAFAQYAVSLNANRMAVGVYTNNSFNNSMGKSGAVYLYSFTDSTFSGGILESIMGAGYTGGKNVNLSSYLGAFDYFGFDVSLDGNRLAVGSFADDGSSNAMGDSGSVYLFSFTDSAFNGATLESRIGYGYTGGKNYSMSSYLGNSDYFGQSVSLNGNRLAVGARGGDGFGNTVTNAGEVYLFSFADSAFSTPVLQGILGNGFTGGKNLNITLDASDYFGWDVSLNGNRLAVSSSFADGNGNPLSSSGEVRLFSFTDATFSGGTLEATLGKGYTGGKNVDLSGLETGDYFGMNIALDGNRLVVGAMGDDGNSNASADSGAVYLFSFTDSVFNGATLEGRIGNNYAALGGKNVSRPLEAGGGDMFGYSLSLYGNTLVVGSPGDDAPSNQNSGQGAYHFYTFTDSAFNGTTWQGTLGYMYSGGKNIAFPYNTAADSPSDRLGVSVSSNRIAIGMPWDDGFGDSLGDSGAVYLYSFANSNFDTPVLESIIGSGYTGGKNIDLSNYLNATDLFGYSVSLDGNRLAVGAVQDDGNANALTDSGAVYLFSFTDNVFSGGTLESRIGRNYTGGKNYNPTNLTSTSDWFGSAVSLDGNRLAIGARLDDGMANNRGDSGAVYLFSFADSVFTTPTLQSIIGYGYTGGKNYNLSQLDVSDVFGDFGGVSLDGNRLVVTAAQDDGAGNTVTNSGAAYLFTFADSLFTTPTLQATIGYGYTGGKNINASYLEATDLMAGAALDGSVLALGISRDDGYNNTSYDLGAVQIYNFDDLLFTNGQLDATIGYGYTGGKNINTAGIVDAYDYMGANLSMDQGSLVVTLPGLDGNVNYYSGTGGVFIYRGNSYAPADGYTFANLSSTTIGITPANISALLSTPQNVTLQASNDITVDNDIIVNNASGNGGTLTLQAGRSIIINGNITTDNGDLNLYANEDLSTGVQNAQRDTGAATITMSAGTSINAGTGNVSIRLDDGTSKTYRTSGNITLNTITSNSILAQSIDPTSSIVLNGALTAAASGTAITLASGKDFTNNYGASALNTPAGRWLVYSDSPVLDTANGVSAGFTLNNCTYGGACGTVPGTGNGLLYQYGPNLLSISVNTSRYYGDANPTAAALQSLYVYNGFQNGDTASVLDALPTPTIAGTATSTAAAGTTHAITLSGGGDNFYSYYYLDASQLSITQKPVTATWIAAPTKIYGDANPAPSLNSFTYSGFANSDTAGSLNPTVTTNFGSVTTATGTGTYAISATFSVYSANYLITAPNSTITITPRDITAAWTGVLSRTYGDANPTVSTSNFTYTGLVNGNTGSVITATGNYGSITGSSDVGTYSVGAFFTAANYNVVNAPTTTLTINKRNITGVVSNSSRAYGDANPNFSWNNVTWSNLANGETGAVLDAMTIAAPTATATANAGTTHNITLTGFSDNNYNLTGYTAGTLSINKRDITGTIANASRAYGDANPAFGWSNVSWSNLANGETGAVLDAMTIAAPTATATSNAGTTHNITLTGFSDNNYNLTGYTAGTLSIDKRDITGTVANASRTYGDANPSFSWSDVSWSNLANGENGAVLDAMTIDAPTATATANAGTSHSIDLTGFSDNNYNLTGYTAGTLSIDKRDITGTVANASRTYGDANPSFSWSNVSWSNLANGETGAVMDAMTIDASTATATVNAGTSHSIDLTGFSDNNYNLTGYTAGTLSIDKRDITGTVANASRSYGDANPSFSWSDVSWSNLANGETGAALDAMTIAAPTATATSNAGTTHNITLTGFSDNNYNLTGYTAGTLSINKRDITGTVANASRTYGDANPSFSWSDVSWSNLANGENGAVLDAMTIDAPTATATANAGTSHSIDLTSFSDNNYSLTGYTAGSLGIDLANLTLQVRNAERRTQMANPTFSYALLGLKGNDTASVVTGVTLTTPATLTSPAGQYQISASGGSALNYVISAYLDGVLTISENSMPSTVEKIISGNINTMPEIPQLLPVYQSTGYQPTLPPTIKAPVEGTDEAPEYIKPSAGGSETATPPASQTHTTRQGIVIIPDDATRDEKAEALISITESLRRRFIADDLKAQEH